MRRVSLPLRRVLKPTLVALLAFGLALAAGAKTDQPTEPFMKLRRSDRIELRAGEPGAGSGYERSAADVQKVDLRSDWNVDSG